MSAAAVEEEPMRLIYRSGGKPVAIGDRVLLRDGEVEVTGLEKPHKPSAAGRVILKNDLGTVFTLYVTAIGGEWIEREDRGWSQGETG